MILRRALIAIVALLVCVARAEAQTSPNLTYRQVPSADQWNGYFSRKAGLCRDFRHWPHPSADIADDQFSHHNRNRRRHFWRGVCRWLGGRLSRIGATTPSTGKFTNLGATGTSTLSGPIASQIGTSILASGALCNNTTDDAAAAIRGSRQPAWHHGCRSARSDVLIGSSNLNVPGDQDRRRWRCSCHDWRQHQSNTGQQVLCHRRTRLLWDTARPWTISTSWHLG